MLSLPRIAWFVKRCVRFTTRLRENVLNIPDNARNMVDTGISNTCPNAFNTSW